MNRYKHLTIFIAAATLILVNLPIVYFYLVKNPNYLFLGRRPTNSEDTYTYVSFIEQARQGRFLFDNQYTSEAQKPLLFRPSYLSIGKVAGLTGISSIFAYHLSRIVFSLIFLFVLYQFLTRFFTNAKHRLLAFFIVCLSSGLGLLFASWSPSPSDLWVSETLTFLALGEAPHFILSLIFMLLGYGFFLDFLSSPKPKFIILFSLFFLLLSFEHPYDLFTVAPIIFITAFLSGRNFLKSSLLAFTASFGLLFQLYTTHINPIMQAWESQNVLTSPSPTIYLIGYGLLIPLAILGLNSSSKNSDPFCRVDPCTGINPAKLIIVWLFVTIIAAYLPIPFQIKLIEGIHIPLSILATSGILILLSRFKRYQTALLIIVLILLPLTSIYFTDNDFKLISNQQNRYYYFIDRDELKAINWLGSQTNFTDIILANKDYGNLIPGLIGRKVFLGHRIQTISLDSKIAQTNSFILNTDTVSTRFFLEQNHITYIFLGKNDAMTQYGFHPDSISSLKQVYSQNGVTIYHLQP